MANKDLPKIILEDELGNKKQVTLENIEDPETRNDIEIILSSPKIKVGRILKKPKPE